MATRRWFNIFPVISDFFSNLKDRAKIGEYMNSLAERPPVLEINESFTVQRSHETSILAVNPGGGTLTITLPAGFPTSFVTQVRQVGSGTVRIVADSGVTAHALSTAAVPLQLAEVWAQATLEVHASVEWVVSGQLA